MNCYWRVHSEDGEFLCIYTEHIKKIKKYEPMAVYFDRSGKQTAQQFLVGENSQQQKYLFDFLKISGKDEIDKPKRGRPRKNEE